jgi:hypothetical protein
MATGGAGARTPSADGMSCAFGRLQRQDSAGGDEPRDEEGTDAREFSTDE